MSDTQVTTTTKPFNRIVLALQYIGILLKTIGNAVMKALGEILKVSTSDNPWSRVLVTVLVVALIVGAVTGVIFGGMAIFRNDRSTFNIIRKKIRNAFTPSYKTKITYKNVTSIFSDINKDDTKNVIDRPIIVGRCDNLTMKESKLGKSGGMCKNTIEPSAIKWVIDSDSMADYDSMNDATKKLITGNGQKYVITIPWSSYESDGTYYYPDCSKAVFSDGTSATHLFTDDVKMCIKNKIPRNQKIEKKRKNNWNTLNDYAP